MPTSESKQTCEPALSAGYKLKACAHWFVTNGSVIQHIVANLLHVFEMVSNAKLLKSGYMSVVTIFMCHIILYLDFKLCKIFTVNQKTILLEHIVQEFFFYFFVIARSACH